MNFPFSHAVGDSQPGFDPAPALAAEGVPVPQPIDIAAVLEERPDDAHPGEAVLDHNHPAAQQAAEAGFNVVTTRDELFDHLVQREGVDSAKAAFALGFSNEFVPAARVEVVNPKEAAGSRKPAVWSVFPRWVSLLVGRVMETGASKYGRFNYRDSAIAATTYEDAMERHAQLWFDGEDDDPESGVSHLAHVIACATLLLDAQATGKLVDNRQRTGIVRRELERLEHLRLTLPFPGDKL